MLQHSRVATSRGVAEDCTKNERKTKKRKDEDNLLRL